MGAISSRRNFPSCFLVVVNFERTAIDSLSPPRLGSIAPDAPPASFRPYAITRRVEVKPCRTRHRIVLPILSKHQVKFFVPRPSKIGQDQFAEGPATG